MNRLGSLRTTRDRLEIQGFTEVSDERLAEAEFGIRVATALCAVGGAIGAALAWPWFLLGLAGVAAAGAVFSAHPFDAVYNYGLRHALGRQVLPLNGAPRRFACAVAAVWRVVNAALFFAGWTAAGYVLGGLFVATAAWVASTHICPQSIAWTLMFGRRERTGV